jgi:3-hydroxyacyl-CoA dehydrogenase
MKRGLPVKFVGVIGAGMMGAGIAINFLKKGIPVGKYLVVYEFFLEQITGFKS